MGFAMPTLTPHTPDALRDALAEALAAGRPVEVTAGGSKRGWGNPVDAPDRLDLTALSGILLYQPDELVLTARAATPLGEIDAALAARRQRLAFEPPDLGPLWGAAAGRGTLGGALACKLGGPRRPWAGAGRDHLLGFKAVSGRGEAFKAGGRVVKNVTGFDLSKLMAGSFGTLAVMSEVTVRVVPAAERAATLLVPAADATAALAVMTGAAAGRCEISGAAYLPAGIGLGTGMGVGGAEGRVALRLEGPAPSVAARLDGLGQGRRLDDGETAALWRAIGDASILAADRSEHLWRLSLPPASAPAVVAALPGRWFLDWAGGLIWLATGAADDIRPALAPSGGHATLMRAPDALKRALSVFHPQPVALVSLAERVRRGFDPGALLNPGRMG